MARRHGAVIFATGLYVVVALYYRYWGGLSITIDSERNTWDWFWQAAPIDLLRGRLLETVFYFHAQPPVYNVVGGVLAKLFYPHHLEALYTLNIVMGALMVMMAGLMLSDLIPWRPLRLLLLFFMLTSTFSRQGEVELAAAGGGAGTGDARPVFLQLGAEDLTLNASPVALDELVAALGALAEDEALVLVALRPEVTAQRLIDLLGALRATPYRVQVLS